MRAMLLLLLLAACGVAGPPVPPEPREKAPEPGVTIGGTAEMGVSGGF